MNNITDVLYNGAMVIRLWHTINDKIPLKSIGLISVIISILHFFEDAALIMLGRYTEINVIILFAATITFGIVVAIVVKIPAVHNLLHDDED